MKPSQFRFKNLAAAMFFLIPHFAFAGEAKVEQVPAEEAGAAVTRVTLHVERVTAEEAIKQFSKASGVSLDLSTQEGQPVGPVAVIYYDLDIKDLPLQSALDRLGRVLSRQFATIQTAIKSRCSPINPTDISIRTTSSKPARGRSE